MIGPELLADMLKDPGQIHERLNAIIAERSASDERFGALAQIFSQSSEPAPSPDNSTRRIALERVRMRVTQMRKELAAISERSGLLASALGACSACLGGTADCGECHGQGSTGWRMPDPVLFQQFISPAIARLSREFELQMPEKGTEA